MIKKIWDWLLKRYEESEEYKIFCELHEMEERHRKAGCENPEICGGPPEIIERNGRVIIGSAKEWTVDCVIRNKHYDDCKTIVQNNKGE